MQAPTNRTFTAARIVALVLIALVVSALAYLRFAPDAGPVSVPAGAHAGDLILKPCTYATEKGAYAADCGTLVVPENRGDPHSRLIALPVTRVRARAAHPGTAILRLEGGPGVTNMQFSKASRFAGKHDVILVGYRGVDGSSRLDCPEVASALKHSADFLGARSFRAYGNAFRSCADRLQHDGVDLAGYSLPQRVDDLEAARRALGYQRVDLLSESAGTRTAMIYAWRYPKSIERSVMIGVNPPGNFLWYLKSTDEQIQKYSAACANDASCSKRTDDLAALLKANSTDIPGHWWFLPIKRGNVRIASFYGLMEATDAAAPLSGPMTLDTWLAADEGDASGYWFMSLMADVALPKSFVWGDLASVGRVDVRAAQQYFSPGERHGDSILGSPGTDFIWGGGQLTTAWPAGPDDNAYSQVRSSRVPTLLIGGSLDGTTPPQNATRELLPHLPNGRQVVLPNLGHTTDFWSYQPKAGSRLVNTFLDGGEVDDSLYTRAHVDFTPGVSQPALAKGFAGTMVGLALLTLLSLLLMARRVHRRGRFGRKSGAALRSVYSIILGLGGWFLGVLLVITTMPGVPIDDALLAVLSIGVPVGLGIYLAWVHRDWPAQSKAVGFTAAAAGALAGAWLGFHAAVDMLALVTAIAGSIAGANLALILLDMSRAHSAGSHPAAKKTVDVPSLEPASPTGAGMS
jgi:pimeloyl-ACP methyl ester carboxylesterase